MTDQEMNDLQPAKERIYALAAQFKHDPFPIHWEVVPATIMYEFGESNANSIESPSLPPNVVA